MCRIFVLEGCKKSKSIIQFYLRIFEICFTALEILHCIQITERLSEIIALPYETQTKEGRHFSFFHVLQIFISIFTYLKYVSMYLRFCTVYTSYRNITPSYCIVIANKDFWKQRLFNLLSYCKNSTMVFSMSKFDAYILFELPQNVVRNQNTVIIIPHIFSVI